MKTEWRKILLVREPGGDLELSSPMKESKRGAWEYQEYWPESRVLEELETAWLRGYFTLVQKSLSKSEVEQAAADYAGRIVGGSTRPERPKVGQ